jgi:Fe-S cluster assembly ATPase SufC
MSILNFLFLALREAKVAAAIVATIVVIFALAYMIFQQSLLMQADLEIYSTVVALGWFATIERFLKASNELIVAYFIMLPFKLTAEKLLVEALVDRSPSSLLLMKENAYALKNAALRALQSLVENCLNVITPIVLLVSRGAALSFSLDSMQLLIVVACLTSVFLTGSAILAYDHKKKKSLSKKETEVGEQARSLMTSIATLVINGAGKILPTWMISLKREESIPSTKHDVIMAILYGFLEIATTGIPVALVWVLKGKNAFLPLYIIIQPMFWNCWYLFWTVKSLVVSTAPWAQYAEFIDSSEPSPINLSKPTSAHELMSVFGILNEKIKEIKEVEEINEVNEVELIGPSGCGKTTLMRKIIAEICSKFMLGYILYIDQFACLPLGLTIIEYYSSAFTDGKVPENFEKELLHHVERLGIANIINKDTLKKSFSNPSGGEKKRIIFLKYILPILMDSSDVMIAFLDEVSAGLDTDSFHKVRVMIENIKAKGVKVVSIDHHEHKGMNTLKVEVLKEVLKIPHRFTQTTQKVLSFWQKMIVKFFPHVYHKEEDDRDLEMGEGSTDTRIIVWAPALGIDKPK